MIPIPRKKEIQQLMHGYNTMQNNGSLQIRFVCGEAGSGKTVLVNQFLEEAGKEAEQTLFVSSYCSIRSEYNIPYQPFKELLKQLLNDVKEEEENDTEKVRKTRIKEALTFCAKTVLDHAPDLVGSFIPGVSVLSAIGQSFFKEKEDKPVASVDETKILEQYVDAIRAISAKYKLVLILDDLQWIDNSSVNLLYQLIIGLQNSPVFIIGCYRSTDIDITVDGEKHPLSKLITEVKISHGNVFINLDLADENERKSMMNAMLDSEKNIYDTRFREKLFEHTNGNPLFVNELINLLKEEGMLVHNNDHVWMNNAGLHWKSYPVRIEGIIQERIGRLEDSLVEILSHASVQGYNFIAQVLSKTMGEPERNLLLTLSKTLQKQHHLINENDCVRSSQGIVSRFNFSNYIFQQYLYQELSMTQRMMLHSDTAAILEDYFKDNIEEVSGDIAHHYELSGEYEKAIKYIKITVASMMRISGYEEAAVLIKKAISFLDEMAQTEEVKKEILYFTIQLCICYRTTKGWGNPEVGWLYDKALDLCNELQEFDHIEVILFGKWSVHLAKLELKKCLELAHKNKEIAEEQNNNIMRLNALVALANTEFWMGNLNKAETYSLSLLEELEKDASLKKEQELNRLFAFMFLLLVSYHKNTPSEASEYKRQLLELIAVSKDNFCQVVAYQALSWHSWLTGEVENLNVYVRKFAEIAEKYNFRFYIGISKMFYGASLYLKNIEDNTTEDLIKEGYRILTDSSQSDPTSMHSIFGLILARYYRKKGRQELFRELMDKTIETSLKSNEKCYLDELYILMADYYREKGETDKAAEYLQKVLKTAQENGASNTIRKIKTITN